MASEVHDKEAIEREALDGERTAVDEVIQAPVPETVGLLGNMVMDKPRMTSRTARDTLQE